MKTQKTLWFVLFHNSWYLLLNFIWYLCLLPIRYYTCIVHVIPSINILFHNFSCNCTTVYIYRWQILSKAIRLQLPSSTYDTRLRYKSKWGVTKLQNIGNFELNEGYLLRKNFFCWLSSDGCMNFSEKYKMKQKYIMKNNPKFHESNSLFDKDNYVGERCLHVRAD